MEREDRPWGYYVVLEDNDSFKVKRIVVNPGGKLSYQSHDKRSEDWTIVSGRGVVVFNGTEYNVGAGHHFTIPVGSKHRIMNNSDKDLVFIEVQTGQYFGEDDIVRYNDEYGRVQ